MNLSLFIIICLINLIIVTKIETFSKIVNLYDFPDKTKHIKKISLIGGSIIMFNIFFYF